MKVSSYLSLYVDETDNIFIEKMKFNLQTKDKYKNQDCAICLSNFKKENINEIIYLKCKHKFCFSCLDADRKKKKIKSFFKCPSCVAENNKYYIIDSDNNINYFIKMNHDGEKQVKTPFYFLLN